MRSPRRAASADLTGRIVVITGAGRGIGAATAAAFVAAGARVAVADIDRAAAEDTAARLGPAAQAFTVDVTDRAAITALFDDVEAALGRVDVMVNNAGIMPVTAFDEEPPASVRRQLDINVAGVIYGCQEAIRRMRPIGGTVVNIASAAGRIGYPGVATYSATKFAVVGLTDTLALEYADTGIDFVCVMPSLADTELAAGIDEHRLLKNLRPDAVAEAIVDGVVRRRRRVDVPGWLGAANLLHDLLPPRWGAALMTALGADHQILSGAGAAGRVAYEQRAAADCTTRDSAAARTSAGAGERQGL